MGVSYLLPRIAGAGKAREMMLTGRVIDSAEADKCGLVHEVVPDAELMAASLRMARLIADNNEYGVWQTKIGLNAALDSPSLRHAKEIENRTQVLSGYTGNAGESGRALVEKRPPNWKRL
jgi:enoyl-CoA hydratase/carnithine racemase